MKYASFPWRLLEAALSILNFSVFFIRNIFFEKELVKIRDIAINAES
jgi:hypothetical protein